MTGRVIIIFLVTAAFFTAKNRLAALPIYAARAARTCDNCHLTPYKSKMGEEWKNPPLKYRKCNLSCQGCHVNPGGGGIRTVAGRYYSKSTLPMYGATNRPYRDANRTVINVFSNKSAGELGLNTKSDTYREKIHNSFTEDEYREYHENEGKKYPARGFYENDILSFGSPLFVDTMADQSVYAFDRNRYGDLNADPLLTVGFDVRPAVYSTPPSVFPMQLDAGFSLHPLEHLSFSGTAGLKGRSSGYGDSFDRKDHTVYQVQSAFMMIHELPYASYLMTGLFLPEFGIRDDDHTAYGRKYFDMDHTAEKNLVYGVQGGMAPNYPYLSFSWFANKAESNTKTNGYGYSANAYIRNTAAGGGVCYIHKTRDFDYGGDLDAVNINGYLNLWGLYFPMRYIAPMTLQAEYSVGRKPRTQFHDKYFSSFLLRYDYLVANGINVSLTYMYYDSDWDLKDDAQWRTGPGIDWTIIPGIRLTANIRITVAKAFYGSPDLILFVHGYY